MIFLSISFVLIPDVSFSEHENRRLQSLPEFSIESFMNNKYMYKLEDYLNEQFPYRLSFMKLRTMIYSGLNIKYINRVYLAEDDYLIMDSNDCNKCNNIVNSINAFYDKLDDNVNVSLMIVPDAIAIYSDKLPKNVTPFNQIEAINYVYENVDLGHEISVYDIFMENKDKYQLYYKTDHHYTLYGAYLAYVEYCKNNNIDYKNLEEYKIEKVSDTFSGILESRIVHYRNIYDTIEIVNKDIDVSVYYPYNNFKRNSLYNFNNLAKKNKYRLFLDGNHSLIIINREDIINDSKLLIIKDSYANSMIPFLVDNYSEMHIIDLRPYDGMRISDYIKENKIDEVLILYNFNTFALGSLNNIG